MRRALAFIRGRQCELVSRRCLTVFLATNGPRQWTTAVQPRVSVNVACRVGVNCNVIEASDAGPLSEYVNRRDDDPIDALGHCDTVTFSGDDVHGAGGGGGG